MKYFPDSILLERIAFLKGLTILRDSSFYPEKGMRHLEGAARRYPESAFAPSALLVVAQEYTKLKFYPEAMGLYRRIISQYPDSPYEAKILLGKAKIYKTRKMFGRADAQLKEALRQATDDDDKGMATFPYGRVL